METEQKKVELKTDVVLSKADREKAYESILSVWPMESKFQASSCDLPSDFKSAQSTLREVKEEIKADKLEKAKIAFDNFIEFVSSKPEAAGMYSTHIKEFEIARDTLEKFAKYILDKEKAEAAAVETKRLLQLKKPSIFNRRH
jgi:hypothetical protein